MEFSDIALAKLLQAHPDLGRLVVTFKDVSEELMDESDTQVGLFILKAGEEFFYVPVISKAGNVFPIDSIYHVSAGKFLPITRKTLEFIINSQAAGIGKQTKIPSTVVQNPSVYDLINPPRTGKFVYATSSRLTEFLASLPDSFKQHVREKIVSDKEVYTKLNKIFGLEDILRSLLDKATEAPKHKAVGSTATYSVITGGNDLGQEEVKSILEKGYAIRGSSNESRVAINAEDYSRMGSLQTISNIDAGKDYKVILSSGHTRTGYVPKTKTTIDVSDHRFGANYRSKENGRVTPIIFENSDYAITGSAVITGEGSDKKDVLKAIFEFNPPIMLKDLSNYGSFAIFNSYMDLIGIFSSSGNIKMNQDGASLRATDMQTGEMLNILAFRNFKQDHLKEGNNLYIPFTSLVIKLGSNITNDLEVNVNSAQKKRSITELLSLGCSMDLSHDGVEFSVNGTPVGGEPKVVELLVIKEGIHPVVAESFIKQAKENKRVKVYLSKKADFSAGEIPQFGEPALEQVDNFGAGKDTFLPSIKSSLDTNDGQVIEATIISELLQSPDVYEQIEEYLPDIEEAVDRLGRVLLISRINLDTLSKSRDADELFAFLASLKNVYRNLGESLFKLRQLVTNANVSK